jgi:hypothetical protein
LQVCVLAVLLVSASCEDGGGCLDSLGIVITSGSLYSEVEFDAEARWSAGGNGCPDNYTWSANAPLSIVGPANAARVRVMASEAGTGRLNVRAGAGTEFAAARDVDVLSSTGWALVSVEGLGEGVAADIVLTGPAGESARVVGDSMVGGLDPGIWTWQTNEVTGGIGHRWIAVNGSGTFTVLRNTPTLLPLAYRRITAQVNFEARNVPLGTIGDFVTLTRDGGQPYTFIVPGHSIAVEAGRFTWVAGEVDDRGYWFVPRQRTGEFTLQPDFNYPFVVDYDAQRGFLDLRANGLPSGVVIDGTLVDGGNVYTVSIPGAGYRSPAEYALDVPELTDYANTETNRFETFRAALPTRQFHLLRGVEVVLVVDMYLANWHATFDSGIVYTADPFNLAPLIGLPASMPLRITVTQPPPTSGGAAGNAAVNETIGIVGPPPWVTVTGPLAADSTFTAAATGTVAGYPNVAVTFTGRVRADGNLEGTMQLGSDTAPTGLPGGAVRLTVTGVRRSVEAEPQAARPAANTAVRSSRSTRR